MIHPTALHRLLVRIVNRTLDPGEDTDRHGTVQTREILADFAGRYELDLEDTATLYRVAAGEAIEPMPTVGPGKTAEIFR